MKDSKTSFSSKLRVKLSNQGLDEEDDDDVEQAKITFPDADSRHSLRQVKQTKVGKVAKSPVKIR